MKVKNSKQYKLKKVKGIKGKGCFTLKPHETLTVTLNKKDVENLVYVLKNFSAIYRGTLAQADFSDSLIKEIITTPIGKGAFVVQKRKRKHDVILNATESILEKNGV
jgi:hypothetical protein